MAPEKEEVLDLEDLVTAEMTGKKGFAQTKKLRKLGMEGYKSWLEGKLAEKMVRKNDPRKRKRAARASGISPGNRTSRP